LKAVVLGANAIAVGEHDVTVTGGMESMTNAPYLLPKGREGFRLGHAQVIDSLIHDGLWDAYGDVHMGSCGELCARENKITREEQDAYALRSNQRAARAWSEGRFAAEVVPVSVGEGKRAAVVERDEHFRGDTTLDELGRLRPVFRKDGSITAGNASAITDGAAALLVLSEAAVAAHGVKPQAVLLGAVSVGVDPSRMGLGPVPAVRRLLERHALKFDPERLNPNGGGIALGHPTGCSGARIIVGLVHELARTRGRFGIATLCVSGGQGMAVLVERV
jgi:acetyl-CoA C-acetyltransferase